MQDLWNKEEEKKFFLKYLTLHKPEKLFYKTKEKKFYAYWPKKYKGVKSTLQSRNSFVGKFTEEWVKDLFQETAETIGGYTIQNGICEELGITKDSKADLIISKTNKEILKPEDIIIIFEIKMSIVWNWELKVKDPDDFELICIGDYNSHQGTPSLLRSDSMLKAIGKSTNIKVSDLTASKIPIIIIGNTPVSKCYYKKVDILKKYGIIQGFWSINPRPLEEDEENLKKTSFEGFYKFDSYDELKSKTCELIKEAKESFFGLLSKEQLGRFIEIANKELDYKSKANIFLKLLGDS